MAGRNKITISTLRAFKRERRKFSMITCYDFATAKLMEEAEIASLLVGDTYAEVCLGHSTTLPVSLDHMVTPTSSGARSRLPRSRPRLRCPAKNMARSGWPRL